MRVIGGRISGRVFMSPKSKATHPMSDKARGGLFNTLGDINALTVLDVFAGSGALSIEAISRGAITAIAVESDSAAQRVIKQNIEELGLNKQIKATRSFFSPWSNKNKDSKFDLVLADPPYNQLRMKDLSKLPNHLKPSGTLVLSWPSHSEPLSLNDLTIVLIKNYGDATLVFYKKIS